VEGTAECAQAVETDVETNVRHVPFRSPQKKHRAFHAPALEIAVWGFAERRTEGAYEVRLGYLRNPREPWDAERFPNVRSIASLARSIRRLQSSVDRPITLIYTLCG
jgi:hypothetical protein